MGSLSDTCTRLRMSLLCCNRVGREGGRGEGREGGGGWCLNWPVLTRHFRLVSALCTCSSLHWFWCWWWSWWWWWIIIDDVDGDVDDDGDHGDHGDDYSHIDIDIEQHKRRWSESNSSQRNYFWWKVNQTNHTKKNNEKWKNDSIALKINAVNWKQGVTKPKHMRADFIRSGFQIWESRFLVLVLVCAHKGCWTPRFQPLPFQILDSGAFEQGEVSDWGRFSAGNKLWGWKLSHNLSQRLKSAARRRQSPILGIGPLLITPTTTGLWCHLLA